ncbi:MAG: methionine biosynthesis protein MetW [Patescibacteria group bacterium]
MNVKNFENERWGRENQKISFRHKTAFEIITAIHDKEISVLDLGCGDGLFLSLLKEKGINGKGLDISEEGVAKTKNRGFEASIFDFSDKLTFADKTFDVVVSLDVLEHLYNPESLLKEASRVSNRFVIIGVPNFNSLPARIQVFFGAVPENNRPKKGHIYWFNYFALKKMISENNLVFKELRVNTIMENRFLIGNLFKIMAKIWPSLFALSFVVRLEKKLSNEN